MHKKPTGKIGPNRLTSGRDGASISWHTIDHSDSKTDIEMAYCKRFLKAMGQTLDVESVTQNPENDFDFTLETKHGNVNFDLAEIVIPDADGNPYKSSQIEMNVGVYEKAVLQIIAKKSEAYRSRSKTPIYLLLYITHWRFRPSDDVVHLIMHDLKYHDHEFQKVFLYLPIGLEDGQVHILYPTSIGRQKTADLDRFRGSSFYILNPEGWNLG